MQQRVVAVFATHAEVIPCDHLLRRHGTIEYPFGIVLDGPLVEIVENDRVSAQSRRTSRFIRVVGVFSSEGPGSTGAH